MTAPRPRRPANAALAQPSLPVRSPVSLAVALAAALWAAPAPLWALPQDAVATLGQVVVRPVGSSALDIVQSSARAALDWRSFSIAAGERVVVHQPDAASVLFSRVTGGDPSLIFGQLQANGRVFLSNPRGILFGAGAQVDVAGLVATTLAVNTTALVNGNYQLSGANANTGALQMDGSIRAPAGTVALVGPSVRVGGQVLAGRVGLAAAAAVQVDVDGDGLIFFNLRNDSLAARLALLPGAELRAGSAELRALARSGFADTVLNLDGVVRATGLRLQDGRVVIDGGSSGISQINGQVRADNAATGRGGEVLVLGDKLLLASSAKLDASGAAGGGSVRVGGDLQGSTAATLLPYSSQAASQVLVQAGATLQADATRQGDGGRVIVWSDQATRFAGAASVRGGPLGGDGGLVEVSSKGNLLFAGSVDRSAPLGRSGRLLLDPLDLEIGAAANLNGDATLGDDLALRSLLFADQGSAFSKVTAAQVKALLAGGDVTLQASNNLSVTSAITAGEATDFALTLQAGNNLTVNAPISLAGSGKALTLQSNADTGIALAPAKPAGVVTVNSPLSANGAIVISNGVAGTGQHVLGAALTASSLQLTGGIKLAGSNAWTLAGNSSVAGVIADGSSAGQLLKAGAGVLTLTGANSYSGGSTVQAGMLQAQSNTALGTGAVSVASGAALGLSGGITLANAVTLAGVGINDGGLNGGIDGGALRSLSGNNTVSGAVTLAGAARINADAGSLTLGSISAVADSAFGLRLGGAGGLLLAGAINSGIGALSKDGAGTLTLSAANSYSGGTTVQAGMLEVKHNNALGSGLIDVSPGAALGLSGGITLANAVSLAGVGINDGGLNGGIDRGALRSLGGDNTVSGVVTLAAAARINADAGTLTLASGSALQGSGFALQLGGAGNLVVARAINTGSGALTKDGAGGLTLSGANGYTGGTTLLQGTLVLQGGAALADGGAVALSNGTTLTLQAAETIGPLSGQGGVVLGNNTLTVLVSSGSSSFAGALSGAGALVKQGAGDLVLAGSNNHTGGTSVLVGTLVLQNSAALADGGSITIAAGARLQLDAAETIGALAGSGQVLLGSSTLTVGGGVAGTASGSFGGTLVGGSGGLTKSGSGTQTLLAASSYSGATLVAGGRLDTSAANLLPSSSAVTVAAGATLALGGSQTLASLAGAGTLVLGSNPLQVGDASATVFSGVLTGSGSLAKQGTGTLALAGDNSAYSGSISVLDGVLQARHANALGGVAAGTSVAAGASLALAGGITLAEPVTLAGTGSGVGAAATGALRNSSGNNTVTAAITLNGAVRINSDAGNLTLASGQPLAAGANLLSFGGAGNTSLADVLTGAALLKDGSGTLTLSAANGYSGATQVSAGNLATTSTGSLPSSSALTLDSGASLQLGADQSLAALAGAGSLALGSHALVLGAGMAAGSSSTFSGVFTGSGPLAKQGSGVLVLAGNSPAYSGAITVQAGVLRAQAGGALGNTAGNTSVSSGAALELAGGITLAEPLRLSGSGVAVGGGAPEGGVLRNISGSNTLTGAVSLLADARINSDTGSLLLDVPGGSALVGVGRNLSVGGAAATSVADGLVLGSGTLIKDGAGTLTLSGSSSLGSTLVNAGTLVTGTANVLPSASALTVAAGATLLLGASQVLDSLAGSGTLALGGGTLALGGAGGNSTFGGSFSGSASLLKQGGGTLVLTGSSPAFNGAITVQAGVLQVQGSQALGSTDGATTVQNGATLALLGGVTLAEPITLDGSGALGAGALRSLAGNNSASGTITLAGSARINADAGRLTLGSAGADAVVGNGQNLQLGGAGAMTVQGAIGTGSGAVLMDGSGTLTLAGANRYTGASQRIGGNVLTSGADRLPGSTALTLNNGATLTLGGAQTLGSLAGAGTLVLGSHALTLGDAGNSSFSGTLSGTGGLVKQGSGSWTLASAQPLFSGPATVQAGTLVLGQAGALAGNAVSLANQAGATLDLAADTTIGALAGGGNLGGVVNLHGFTLSAGGDGSSSQFSGALIGNGGGLTKLGSGVLTLAGASSYSGATRVSAGTLVAAHAAALGSVLQGTSVANGAALEIANVTLNAEPLTLQGSGQAGSGALLGSGVAAAASGAITLAGNSQIGAGAGSRLSLAGAISDAGQGFALSKAGAGALLLSASSNYSGGTQVAAGTLVLAGPVVRPGTGSISVGANRLDLDQGAVLAQAVSLNGGTLGNGDGLGGGTGSGRLAAGASLQLLGNAVLQADGAGLQIDAVISQSGAARSLVVGAGSVTLTAANSYSGGTRLDSGTLVLDGAQASAGTGAITVGARRLQLDHGALVANAVTLAGGTLASTVGGGGLGANASLTLLGDSRLQAGTDGLVVAAPISQSGGARRLDFSGGTITLRGTNTSSGGGSLLAGTLVLDGPAASAGSGTLVLGANRLQVDNGAQLAQPISVAGGSLVNSAGSATLAGASRLTLLGNTTLVVAGGGTGWLVDGVIEQAGGSRALVIDAGAASVTLSSASSYSGGTTVQSGALVLSGAAARPGTGTLAVGNNRLVLNDGALLAQAVTLGAGTLDNSSGIGTLGRSASLTLQGDATLRSSGGGLQVLGVISETGGPRALALVGAVGAGGGGGGGANGGASITLGGINTYTGGTLLAAGTLLLQSGAGLDDNATLTLANSAGVRLQLQADATIGALAGGGAAGGTVLLDGHTLSIGGSGASRFAGVLADGTAPGNLVKQGSGSLTLAGANSLSGSTTVAAGSLVLDHPAALANSALRLADGAGAQLVLAGPARIGSLAGGAGAGGLQGRVLLGSNSLTLGGDGSSTGFAGAISGSGGLLKQGAGSLTLTGANPLTGATSVAAGTLLLGQADVLAASAVSLAGGALGLLADSRIGSLAGDGAVALGGFQLATGADQRSTSFAGAISGSGSLRKEGSGSFSLSGANQIDGDVLISAGTLALQGSAALTARSNVSLANVAGTTLALQASQTIGALAGGGAAGGQVLLGSVGGGPASLRTGGNGASSRFDGQLSGPGQLVKQGSGVLTLGAANSHSGGTLVAQGTLAVLADSSLGASGAALQLGGGTLRADADISLPANRPVSVLAAGGAIDSNAHQIILAGPLAGVGSLNKLGDGSLLLLASSPLAGATQVDGGSLLLDQAGALPNSTVQLAGRAGVLLGLLANASNASIGALAGGSSSGGAVLLGSQTLSTGVGGSSSRFDGSISGSGGLVKQGSGSLTLGGVNSFTGLLRVDGGTLLLQRADALAATQAVQLADTPGVLLQLAADQTIGALAGGGAAGGRVDLAGFALATGGSGADSNFAGVISGTGGLVKQGAGRFTLSGANSFSGQVLLQAGTLALQGGPVLSEQVAVTLQAAPAGAAGPTLALLADQSIGALAGGAGAGAGAGAGSGQVQLGSFNLRTGGDGSNSEFAGVISGSGGLIKQGAGSLTLSGGNRFTGPLQVAGGAVLLQGGAALADAVAVQLANSPGVLLGLLADASIGSLAGGGAAGGAVQLGSHTLAVGGNQASSQFDGVISGNGGLRKEGSGTLTLAGANSFSGATNVLAGRLALQGGAALADGSAVTLADGSAATLQLLSSETLGSLAGGAGLGGVPGAAGSGSVLLGNHTLRTGANNTSSQFSGVISGAPEGDGGLVKLGSGQFTLAGANSFSGGAQVLAGTLATSGNQRLLASSRLQVANGATLLVGGDETVAAVVDLAGQVADGSARLNIGANTLTINTQASAGMLVFSGSLLSQGGRLVKLGDGVFQLGGTAVGGGLLQVDQGVLLSVGGSALSADTVVQVAAGGTLQLASPATVASLALHGSLAGAGLLTITGLTALDSGLVASPLSTGSLNSQGISRLAAPVRVAGSSTVAAGSLTLLAGGLLQSPTIQINSGATLTSGSAGSLGSGAALQVAAGGHLQLAAAETAASLGLAGTVSGLAGGSGSLDLSGAASLSSGALAAPLRSRSLSSQGASSLNAGVLASEQATLSGGTLDLGAAGTLGTPRLTLQAGSLTTSAAQSLAGVGTLVVAAPASLHLGADDSVARLQLAGTLQRADSAPATQLPQLLATESALLDGGQVLTALATPQLRSQGSSLLAAPVLASSSSALASGSLLINSSGQLSSPLLQLLAGSLRSASAQRVGSSSTVQMAAGSQWLLAGDQTLAGLADLPGTDAGAINPALLSLGNASLAVGSGGADLRFSGLLGGTGSLVKQGAGRLVLLRDQAYGDTQIDAGTLQLGDAGRAGSLGRGAVQMQGVLRLQRADDVLLANAISGSGSLQQAGTGSLTLSHAANSYSGKTEVLSGLLRTSAPERLPDASTVTVASGASLVLAGNETLGALLADGQVTLAGSVTSTTGDQRYRAAVRVELPLDTAQPITLSAPGHTVQAQDDGNHWGRLPLSVNAGQLLLSAGRSADGAGGALVYRDLTLGAITLTGLAAAPAAKPAAAALATAAAVDPSASSVDAGRLHLGVLVAAGQAPSGDARIDGLLRQDAGTLLLRAHATPGYSALTVGPGEGIPVDPLKARQLFVADDVISQSANSQLLTQSGSSLQLLAPAGGSINLDQTRNRLAGSVAALSGADWGSAWAALDVSAAAGMQATGQSRINLAGTVLQVGGRGLEADLVRLSAGQLATDPLGADGGSVITARLWYNDAASGQRSSTPGLRLTLLPEAFANAGSFGAAGKLLQVSVGNRNPGVAAGGGAAQPLREGLSAGFVQVLPRASAKGNTAVYLGGPRVGTLGYSFFHDGAGELLELPVFYNGVLPVTPQLAGSLAAVAAVSETARRDGFDEAVRTENVAIRLRAGVIAEVGPGRSATVGSAGLRLPASCALDDAGMDCAPEPAPAAAAPASAKPAATASATPAAVVKP